MKKMLAVMLAAATTMSVGVTAFANDEIGNGTAVVSSYADLLLDSGDPGSSSSDAEDNSSSSDSSSEDESVSLENATDVKIGADEDGVVLGDDVLEPGKEYKFPVSLTVDGKDTKITEELMDGYKFNYSKISSKGMSRFEIEEYKGQYYLYVEARDTVTTKPVDVKYNVKLVRKSNNLSVFTQEVKFQYGYDEADSDYINGLDEGDTVEISNDNPVITGTMEYPADIIEKLRGKGADVVACDALALAGQAGSAKAVNVVLMGVLSTLLDIPEAVWQAALEACVPPKFLELNKKAFALGRAYR